LDLSFGFYGFSLGIFRTLHRSILILFTVVVVSIVTLVHFSVSKIVAEQSRSHQKSISPALSLIVDQLMQPLHISQTLAKSTELKYLMNAETIDEEAVFESLGRLQSEFDMYFFIASEKSRKQYNSDGTQLDLIEGEVNWYFKYKDAPVDAIADIGKWEDARFFIDLKIKDENGEFLGFFGTGQRLNSFLTIFKEYKKQHGYDFIFVDPEQNITLSSDPELLAANSTFRNLADLEWYQRVMDKNKADVSLNNMLIQQNEQDFLIAEVAIEAFDWTLYLLSPLQARQTEISRAFIYSTVSLLVVIFALFLLIYNLLYYFKRDMQKSAKVDSLTKLPNRNRIELCYADILDKGRNLSLILVDIDHFKLVNDNHGHNAGDTVLRKASDLLSKELRADDIIGRWGGEEFVILLPDTSPDQAYEVAQKLRQKLAQMTTITTGSVAVQITASFGVSYTEFMRPMVEVLASADDALYQAKRDGRNLVRIQLIDAA
jgi:diguanylate cyclase (GGDEF)-like protein